MIPNPPAEILGSRLFIGQVSTQGFVHGATVPAERNPQSTKHNLSCWGMLCFPTPNQKGKAMSSGKNSFATPFRTRLLSEFCVLLVADPNSDPGVADPTPRKRRGRSSECCKWPRPAPQHAERAPATPTPTPRGLQVRKQKLGTSQLWRASCQRYGAGPGQGRGPAPQGGGGGGAAGAAGEGTRTAVARSTAVSMETQAS